MSLRDQINANMERIAHRHGCDLNSADPIGAALNDDLIAEVERLMEWARQGDPNAKTIDSGARIMVAGHVPLKWVEMTLPPDDWRP